jgi:hypothetical protein
MTRAFAVVAVAALALTACSSITEGTITDKKFFDEYTTLMPVWISCGNGCTTMVTQEIYTPPCWEFYLRNGEEVGSQCVDPRDWMVHQVGDFYRMPEDET